MALSQEEDWRSAGCYGAAVAAFAAELVGGSWKAVTARLVAASSGMVLAQLAPSAQAP